MPFDNIIGDIERLPSQKVSGCVTSVLGMLIEIGGVEGLVSIGDHCLVKARSGRRVKCEVVGFQDGQVRALPFGTLEGIGIGCRAEIGTSASAIYPSDSWLGRVINAFGEPSEGAGSRQSHERDTIMTLWGPKPWICGSLETPLCLEFFRKFL